MDRAQPPTLSAWQGVMLLLSVYVLMVLFVETVAVLPPEVSRLLGAIDLVVCVIFFTDFLIQLKNAERKWAYLKWGWIDLLSSIPGLPFLRLGRVARLIRIIRLLRGFRSTRVIVTHVFENRARGTLASVAIITFVLIVFSSIAVLNVETEPDASIKTAEDAFWWSLATVSTVGYGDTYPKSSLGHIIGAILIVSGIALFGTFTASIASFFVQQDSRKEDQKLDEVLKKLDALSERLSRIEGAGSSRQTTEPLRLSKQE